MLQKIKAEIEPEMSDKSCLQACVVHTEAIFDPQQGRLLPNLMLFPVGFMAYGDMVKVQDMPAGENVTDGSFKVVKGGAEAPSEASDSKEGTPDTKEDATCVSEPSTGAVEGTPADNPTPATATMKVEAPAEKA